MKTIKQKQTQRHDYFYCYNINLSRYLTSKGINYIMIAREPKSNKLFSQYLQTAELTKAIQEYKNK